MADVYARDAAARGLRLLDALIQEVREGSFRPDESRAGRLDTSKRQRVDGALVDPVLQEATFDFLPPLVAGVNEKRKPGAEGETILGEDADDGEAGGHVTTDSSSSDSDEGTRELVQRQFFPPTAPDGYTFLQHQKSKLLHYMRVGDQRVLACGRMKSQAYREPNVLRYDSAICHACQTAVQRA